MNILWDYCNYNTVRINYIVLWRQAVPESHQFCTGREAYTKYEGGQEPCTVAASLYYDIVLLESTGGILYWCVIQ